MQGLAAPILGAVAGPLIGGLMGGDDSPQQQTSSVQRTEPWAPIIPYLMGSAGNPGLIPTAQNWFNQAPGSTVAGFNPMQQHAMNATFAHGMAGSNFGNTAKNMLADTAFGGYLNTNPYLDAMFNQASRGVTSQFTNAVMPQLASMFSAAGRYGSNSMQNAASQAQLNLGDTLAGMGANIYGQDYANERNRMLQAASLAPQFNNMDLTNLMAASGVGGQQQAMTQMMMDEQLKKLQAYQALLGYQSSVGSSNGATAGQPGSPIGAALGGAVIGDTIGSMFGDTPSFGANSDQGFAPGSDESAGIM